MKKIPKQAYTAEFKELAVKRVSDGQAIGQMDQVTQQNASLVEEAAAAAESLQDQASNLAAVVGVFRLSTIQTSMQQLQRPVQPPQNPRPVKAAPKVLPAARPAKPAPVISGGDREQF